MAAFITPSIVLAEEIYHNPVDKKDYISDHWQQYTAYPTTPITSDRPSSNKVHNDGIVMLSPQSDFEEIGVEPLGDYILSLQKALENQAEKTTDTGSIIVQAELNNSTTPKISFSYTGNISQKFLQNLYDEISKITPLKTQSKTLTFQIRFSIR